jgi:hypothetical protein
MPDRADLPPPRFGMPAIRPGSDDPPAARWTNPTATAGRLAAPARAAGAVLAGASCFLWVLALPAFSYGIWFQSEPVTVGLWAAGGLAALILVALEQTGHPVIEALRRPTIRILVLFVAWNALASRFQAFPGRSWFGSPEVGEGVFSFLALLALTVLVLLLWPGAGARRVIAGSAAASALALGGLEAVLPTGSPWRPEMFAAYAGSVGPAVLLIVAAAMPRVVRPGQHPALGRVGPTGLGVAVAIGLPVVAFSANKTAIGLAALAVPLAWLAARLMRDWTADRRRRWLAWAPAAAIALCAVAVLAPLGFGWYDPLYSLRSRSLLILAALRGLTGSPGALAFGLGWGSYNDVLYQHAFVGGVRGYRDVVWNPDWEGLAAGSFHTHFEALEAVLGAGLIGGVLYLLLLRSLLRHGRRDLLGIAAVAWVLQAAGACFWFPFTLSFPFLAAAMAATVAVPDAAPAGPVRRWPLLPWLSAAVAALLIWGAVAGAQDALAGGRLVQALNRQDPAAVRDFAGAPDDHDRGGVHLWWATLSYVAAIDQGLAAGVKPTEAQALWYARLLAEVDAWVEDGQAGIRLAALGLALRNDLASLQGGTTLAPLARRELPHWGDAVLRVLRLAPARTDIAVPYLAWLAQNRRYLPILGLCARMDAVVPIDRVCLWYGGLAMLSDPLTEEAGFRSMDRALALGVDAVAPVRPDVRALVEAHFKAAPR